MHRLLLLGALFLSLSTRTSSAQNATSSVSKPLIVCTKSTPPMSSCSIGGDPASFTGYDVEVFRDAAALLGLREFKDYTFKCLALADILASLISRDGTCSMATGGITASVEREQMGLAFSFPTYASSLAIMTKATTASSDGWFFVKPFAWSLWLAIGVCLLVFPFIAYVVESLSLKGRLRHKDWRPGLRMSYWEVSWVAMQSGNSSAVSSSTRIMLLAYGVLSLVLLACYSANLTAFLTISKFQTSIQSVDDLRGKAVGTTQVYQLRLSKNYGVIPSVYPSQNLSTLLSGNGGPNDWLTAVSTGALVAFVYDEPLLRYIDSFTGCDLRVLQATFAPFDYAMMFPNTTDPKFISSINTAILTLQSNDTLTDLKNKFFQFNLPDCKVSSDGSASAKDDYSIHFSQVWGIFALFGCCLGLGLVVAAFLIPRRKSRLRRMSSIHRGDRHLGLPEGESATPVWGVERSKSFVSVTSRGSVELAPVSKQDPASIATLEQALQDIDAIVAHARSLLAAAQEQKDGEVDKAEQPGV